jgi:GT2 family glycosyltransferase
MKIAVGIVTTGRAPILAVALEYLQRQRRRPDRTIVCYVNPGDVDAIRGNFPEVEFIQHLAGICRQRNRVLDEAAECDVVLYIDDDFLAGDDYLTVMEAVFTAYPGIVVATGLVLADGTREDRPGLEVAAGRAILDRHTRSAEFCDIESVFNGYGCNMAIRLDVVRREGLRFDEQLPLYGWYEDIDFTRRVGRSGEIVRALAACGVHLGTSGGRTSGVKLGYSQVANPLYLARKGTYPWVAAVRSISRNMLANAARSLFPEQGVDRRGRLRGNAIAVYEMVLGRIAPTRILDF